MKRDAEEIRCRMPKLFSTLKTQTPREIWCPSSKRSQLKDIPQKGVYVFYCNDIPLYVGRSDQIPDRIRSHCRASRTSAGSATFAFILTRDKWGIWKGPYHDGPFPKTKKERDEEIPIKKGTNIKKIRRNRKTLLEDDEIFNDFKSQVERVKSMKLSVIEIEDAYEQATFEVYVARALDTRYNDFRNH